jgi:hypothetical protein
MKINKNIPFIVLFLFQISCYNNNTNILTNKNSVLNNEIKIDSSATNNIKIDTSNASNTSNNKTEPSNEFNNNENIKEEDDYFYIKETQLNLNLDQIFDLKDLIISNNINIKENMEYIIKDTELLNINNSYITSKKSGDTSLEFKYKNKKFSLNIHIDKVTPITSSTISPDSDLYDWKDSYDKGYFSNRSGTVFDIKGGKVKDVIVTVKEANVPKYSSWNIQTVSDIDGKFKLYKLPYIRLYVTAKKYGWTTRSFVYRVSELHDNEIDFTDYDSLQDEPEVTLIKVNDRLFTQGDLKQERPSEKSESNFTTKEQNISFDILFSEPVIKKSFEDNFSILSPEFNKDGILNKFNTDISNKHNLLSFKWSENRDNVTVKVNKPLLTNKENSIPVRYKVNIPKTALVDDNGKTALDVNQAIHTGPIRFGSKVARDSVIFSIENDIVPPTLLDMKLLKKSNQEYMLELYFNETLETYRFKSPLASLNYKDKGFKSSNGELMILSTDNKNIYALAQIDINKDYKDNDKIPYKNFGINGELTNVEVNENKVNLTFSKGTFIKGKRLVLSIGQLPLISNLVFENVSFEKLEDMAGNKIVSESERIFENIKVSGNQRFVDIVD